MEIVGKYAYPIYIPFFLSRNKITKQKSPKGLHVTGFNDTFWIDYEWTGPEICSKSYLLTVRVIDHTPILYAYIYVHFKFRIEILVKKRIDFG